MSPVLWAVVLRVVRIAFSAFREAQSAPVPEGTGGNEKAWRHVFAVELITNSMGALEQRLGRDIVQDGQFKAGVDLLLTGIRLIAESVVRVR